MFRRQAQRFPKAKVPCLNHTCIRGFALAFVRGHDHMFGTLAEDIGKNFIRWCHTCARIDHEQTDIRHINSPLRQPAHATLKALIRCFFEACRVDDSKAEIGQSRGPFAQIPSHPRLIVDQGQFFADKSVKESRFANIWASDNSESKAHTVLQRGLSSALYTSFPLTESVELTFF